jgi:hypothetical protein
LRLQWNMLWEAAQFRRRFFDLEDLPEQMAKIADLGDVNVTFVPRTRARYFEYAPLLHLLPKRVLDLFGLPLLRGGQWPFMADWAGIDNFLPPDFEARLARAWAWTVWPHLMSGFEDEGVLGRRPDPATGSQPGPLGPRGHRHYPRSAKGFPRGRQGQDFRPGHIGGRQCAHWP